MTVAIVGQKDYYKKLFGLQPLKRAHKNDKRAKLFIIKIVGLFVKYIVCLKYFGGVIKTILKSFVPFGH